jgi:hypothetical protein
MVLVVWIKIKRKIRIKNGLLPDGGGGSSS